MNTMNKYLKSKLLFTLALVLVACSSARNSVAEGDYSISVQGIKIVNSGYKDTSDNITPFNQFDKGTTVACLLIIKNGGIISFVDAKSTITTFKDNLGANLIDSNAMHGNGYGLMREISKDRAALMFDITGSNLPSKKSTSIISSGEIVVTVASKSANLTVQNISLTEGTIINTPFGELTISHIRKNSWGEYPHEIVLESVSNLSVIKDIKFKDSEGNTIESKRSGGGNYNIVGDLSSLKFEKNFTLSKKPNKIGMLITYWEDMKTRNIPFSFTTSIGL